MTESKFWNFLQKQKSDCPGKIYAVSIQNGDLASSQAGEYLTGHALLPENYDKISLSEVDEMGKLLFMDNIAAKTKEAVLILLAHLPNRTALSILSKYCENPDQNLEIFAKMALEECKIWNEA